MKNQIVCVYCQGREDKDENGTYYWVPSEGKDGLFDCEPTQPGDYCCSGQEYNTPQAAYDRACGIFD